MMKASADRLVVLGLLSTGHVVFGVVLALQSPLPDVASWGYIAASTVIHFAYYFLLYHSYRLGDLSHVYPIARGMSPVLVALGAQVFAGESLPVLAWLGILVASGGIFMLAGNLFKRQLPPIMVLTAMATGTIIAMYSVVDGMGVRAAGTPRGYIGWLFVMEGIAAGFIFLRLGRRMWYIRRNTLVLGISGGVISALAYGLVIYANSLAPLGMVSTLRETSVIFAALIGVVILHERPWKRRVVASVVVAVGVMLLGGAMH